MNAVLEESQASLDSGKKSLLRFSSLSLIGLKNEELLVHSETFVDSWVEKIVN